MSVHCLNAGQNVTVMYHFLRLSEACVRKRRKAGLQNDVSCDFTKLNLLSNTIISLLFLLNITPQPNKHI